MSVEASRWAIQADVQRSSSKLVLLNLAQLVRYDAAEWTAFASIEYLGKVTHLNRKTVIDALARLREMGAIQDTGRRAGDNRSSIIYRLCPSAVPSVDLATIHTAAGAPALRPQRESGQEPELSLELDLERGLTEVEPTPGPVDALPQRPDNAPADAAPPRRDPEFAVMEPAASPATAGRRSSHPAPVAGAGGTRLPRGWILPDKWRQWTHQVRPQWTEERVDAMAATFTAYWRSRADAAAFSADWFESWRLWVFREHDPQKTHGKAWQDSWSGIVAKGKSLCLYRAPDEPEAYFKLRVFEAAGVPPPH